MEIKKEYTDTDLLLFTKKNCKTNAIQRQLTKSDSLKVVFLIPKKTLKMNLNGLTIVQTASNFCFKKLKY
jgi:hypothetical protein